MSFVHKITSVAITLAMLASLTACGGNNDTPATTTATADTTTVGQGLAPAETTDIATTAPVEDSVDIEALLEGIPVYDIHYVPDTFLDEFENVCEEKLSEYSGNAILFACRFVEYPDVAIVGQITEINGYKYRGINSVIWKGERYYTPEYCSGPGFDAYITDDFIAIDSTGSATGMAYFIYEGGVEYHDYPKILNNSFPTFTMKDGKMRYSCISDQYYVASNQVFAEFYTNYAGHDDYYGSSGTVELVNGKIEYVEESSSTLEEWYADHPYRNQYGDTLDEFLESIRVLYDLKKEDLGKNWRN